MKISDVTNWLFIWDHARHVGLHRLKSRLAMGQIRASVRAFDCGLRKMIAKAPVPQVYGPPVTTGTGRTGKCRFLYAKEVAQTLFLLSGRILEDFEEGAEGLVLS